MTQHCVTTSWVAKLLPFTRQGLETYIRDNTDYSMHTGCFGWTGPVTMPYGHPLGYWGGRTFRPYRVVWALERGPITRGQLYRHGLNDYGDPCHPTCLNLDHGRGLGSASENTRDQVADGTHNQARKTRCPKGHTYTRTDTRGFRVCGPCQRGHEERSKLRKLALKTS